MTYMRYTNFGQSQGIRKGFYYCKEYDGKPGYCRQKAHEDLLKITVMDAEGVVDRESYLRNKKELNEKIEKVQTKYEQIQAVTTAEDDLMKDVKTVEKNAEEVNILKRMTRNIAEIFVEEITIYDSEKIEVKFVFDDLLVDMANRIEKKKEGIA